MSSSNSSSILMNMRELAEYLRYAAPVKGKRWRGQDKALAFLKRRGVPLEHRGKVVLVRKAMVDAALRDEPMPPPKKRRSLEQGA